MNSMQKLVCSTTMKQAHWNNSRILAPDAASEIKQIKRSPGKDLMIIGSAAVVQALARQQLIDEFRFFLFPVALGAGKPLFGTQTKSLSLKLLQTKHFATGVIRVDYARA